MRVGAALSVTALVLATCAPVRGQEARTAQQPAASTEIVRLDVVVTDEQGRLVRDLVREDFDVLEDGKLQRLTDFVFVGGAASPAGAEQAAGPEQRAAGESHETGRHIAIVVDELHLSQRSLGAVREMLGRFLDEKVAADDYVALVLAGSSFGAVQPTRDRAALRQAIARISARGDSIATGQGAQMTPEEAEQILRGEQGALTLASRLLADEPGSMFTDASPRNNASSPDRAGVEPGMKAATDAALAQARNILAEALSRTEVTLGTVEDVLRGLEAVPGRKLCLFVSEGFLVGRGTSEERTRELRLVSDAATRSGTAIYPLATGGLAPLGADASAAGSIGPAGLRDRVARMSEKQTLDTLGGLADDTGGFLIRGGDGAEAGLARLLADNDSLYLLGYEPANQKRDGKFRKIAVRLPRHPEYVVRTRRGYFAPDAKHPRPAPRRPFGPADALQALSAPIPASGVPVQIAAAYVELAKGGSGAVVKARVDAAKLGWTNTKGRQHAEFDLIGGVFDANGQPGPLFAGQRYSFDMASGDLDQLKQKGVQFETNLPLGPGRWEIRMAALDPAHALLGGARQTIEVPDLAERKLTLSDIFLLSASGDPAAGGAARDAHVLRRFRTTDNLIFQVYVYNVAHDGAGASDVLMQVQVHSGGKALFASKQRPAVLAERDGVPLPEGDSMPLSGLAPGSYQLRVVVADRKANTLAHRSVEFTVE